MNFSIRECAISGTQRSLRASSRRHSNKHGSFLGLWGWLDRKLLCIALSGVGLEETSEELASHQEQKPKFWLGLGLFRR